mgnify:CR=1 FL=1
MRNEQDECEGLVGGRVMCRTLAEFFQAARVLLEEEQLVPSPNNHLIAFICDAVRLARENIDLAIKPLIEEKHI